MENKVCEILNVVHLVLGTPIITSYPILDSNERNEIIKKAEKHFKDLIKSYVLNITDKELETAVEDGYYECSESNKFFLTWSD